MGEPRIIDTADLDDGVTIGDGSSIWHVPQGARLEPGILGARHAMPFALTIFPTFVPPRGAAGADNCVTLSIF